MPAPSLHDISVRAPYGVAGLAAEIRSVRALTEPAAFLSLGILLYSHKHDRTDIGHNFHTYAEMPPRCRRDAAEARAPI